jgi:creatinine amidohydrolase/Fe(II)-dependent formamide hydrolase-like protein
VWSEREPLRYERLTWPEVRRAAAEERVALVPVATLEDHGRHLLVDTDLRIVTEVCERAATAAADRADKGRELLEAAVAECVAYVDEPLAKPLPRRRSPAAEGGEAEPAG